MTTTESRSAWSAQPWHTHERDEPEWLDRAACLALLDPSGIGRVAITMRALPLIIPVGYVRAGDDVVFGASADHRLDAALRNSVIAFETDTVDGARGTAWSVCMTGRADPVDDDDILALARRIPPWPPGAAAPERLVRIRSELVVGQLRRSA